MRALDVAEPSLAVIVQTGGGIAAAGYQPETPGVIPLPHDSAALRRCVIEAGLHLGEACDVHLRQEFGGPGRV
jgi:hypothetical protein